MTLEPASYPRHRFPAEIISHAVWLYHVFSLSLRDVELILAERGIVVTHESIRHWCLKFGSDFARRLRRRRPQPGDTWHLDEVFIRIQGVLHYLWRAVDQHGVVLDILVQDRRNGAAAKRFFKRLLHGLQYKPRRLVTDGLRSYGVAQRAILPDVRHRVSAGQIIRRCRGGHHHNRRPTASVRGGARLSIDRWLEHGHVRGYPSAPSSLNSRGSGVSSSLARRVLPANYSSSSMSVLVRHEDRHGRAIEKIIGRAAGKELDHTGCPKAPMTSKSAPTEAV